MTYTARSLSIAVASCWCLSAHGFTYNMPMPGPDLLVTSMITQRALQDKLINEAGGSNATRATGTSGAYANRPAAGVQPVIAAGNANAAGRIASSYPPASQLEAEKLFHELLARYRQLAIKLGQQPDDVGAAVASLLAASYMVYRGVDFPDAQFPALADQMRQVLRSSQGIMAAPSMQKREMYEESAILAMLLAGSRLALDRAPTRQDGAQISRNMKTAAKGYLEKLVGVQADRIRISASGLSVVPE